MSKSKQEGLSFHPKNDEQRLFISSIDHNPLTICRSKLFGSGKTYCAIGHASKLLKEGEIKSIVFCIDSSSLASRLGYLPGTREQKLAESIKFAVTYFKLFLGREYQIHSQNIQYRDVADLDGETFCDSFMILDEAANCSRDDIAMFISRAGHGTRCVILGNESQIVSRDGGFSRLFVRLQDLPCVGLVELKEVLRNGWMAEVLAALE